MREAVGLFENMDQLQEAVKELERTEFPRDALSVLGSDQEHIQPHLGLSRIDTIEERNDVPKDAPIRSEEKTIGAGVLVSGSAYLGAMAVALAAGAITIPAILTAAVIGAAGGATIGGVLAKILGDHYDANIEEQVKNGGLLLWVSTPNAHKERTAQDVLIKYGAQHVRICEI